MTDTTVDEWPDEPEEGLYDFYDNRVEKLWGISDLTHGLPAVTLRKALIMSLDTGEYDPTEEVYNFLKREHAKLVAAYNQSVTVFSTETSDGPVTDEDIHEFMKHFDEEENE